MFNGTMTGRPTEVVDLNGKLRPIIPRFYGEIPKTIFAADTKDLINTWSKDHPEPGMDKEEAISQQLTTEKAAIVHPPMPKRK